MLPVFLVEETTVRESGQSVVLDASAFSGRGLTVTFGITHAVEHESIGLDIHASDDGVVWSARPLLSFTPKSWCGAYEKSLPFCGAKYLKAMWTVKRWSRGSAQPFFRFYLFVEPAQARVARAGAA